MSALSVTSSVPRLSDEPPAVFGTGLLALDVVVGTDPDQTPVLAAGGTCGNVLAALAYLGWEAFPVARLNDDFASSIVRSDLQRVGVALDFAAQAPGAATPIIVQTIRHDRRGVPTHRFSVTCPCCGAWFPSFRAVTQDSALAIIDAVADAVFGGFESPRVFFFDRVSRGALTLAHAFADRGALVVFEPVGVGDPKLFAEALSVAHVLKYSRERLPNLANRALPARSTTRSNGGQRGTRPIVEIETGGAEGLRFRTTHDRGAPWRILPAVPVPVLRDAAGAGDWCTAGFLATLGVAGASGIESARTSDLAEALRVGQAAAAISSSFEGARGVMAALGPAEFRRAVDTALNRVSSLGAAGGRANSMGVVDPVVKLPPSSYETLVTRSQHRNGTVAPLGVGSWTTVCPACP